MAESTRDAAADDLVEVVARAIAAAHRSVCFEQDRDPRAMEACREVYRGLARAAIAVLQQSDGTLDPAIHDVEFTPEELAELRAKLEAAQYEAPQLLCPVTRKELREALEHAYLLGRCDQVEGKRVKTAEDVVHAIVKQSVHSPRFLWAVGIPVQDGEQHG